MTTKFQTIEGIPVLRTFNRMGQAHNALKRAAIEGHTTLVAIDPDGKVHDYTAILRRDYLSKSTLKKAA